jgi:hypothetical protein
LHANLVRDLAHRHRREPMARNQTQGCGMNLWSSDIAV